MIHAWSSASCPWCVCVPRVGCFSLSLPATSQGRHGPNSSKAAPHWLAQGVNCAVTAPWVAGCPELWCHRVHSTMIHGVAPHKRLHTNHRTGIVTKRAYHTPCCSGQGGGVGCTQPTREITPRHTAHTRNHTQAHSPHTKSHHTQAHRLTQPTHEITPHPGTQVLWDDWPRPCYCSLSH
jgi:hypothetical protein